MKTLLNQESGLNSLSQKSLKELAEKYRKTSKTYSDFKINLNDLGKHYLLYLNMSRKKELVELSGEHIAYILFELWGMVFDESSFTSMRNLYIFNPVTNTYVESLMFWEETVQALTMNTDVTIDIAKRTSYIHKWCHNSHYLTTKHKLKPLPDNVLSFKNGLYDLKTNHFYPMADDTPTPYDDYHVTKRLPYDYIDKQESDLTSEELAYTEIIERIFNDWSDGNTYNLTLLQETMMSVLLGNNFKQMIIIQGPGGNGKSTYLELCKRLVGDDYIPINIHQINDDNFLNQISSSTHLIAGDDADTNTVIKNHMNSVFKSLVTNGELMVNKKYSNALVIQTSATFIQLTNTEIIFTENTDAIKDRVMYLIWTNTNFRAKSKDILFNLDDLIKKQPFIQMVVRYVIKNVGYMTGFSNKQHFTKNTQAVMDSTNPIKDFANDMVANGLITHDSMLPKILIYKCYENYCKSRNIKVPADRWFQREFKKYVEELGFTVDTRVSRNVYLEKTPLSFDDDLLCELYGLSQQVKDSLLVGQIRVLTRESIDPIIDLTILDGIREQLTNGTFDDSIIETDSISRRCLKYLAKYEQNALAQSILGS